MAATASSETANDQLIGGVGRDIMTGGANNDSFRSLARSHSGLGAAADIIFDFAVGGGGDKINLSSLSGPAMTYRQNAAFTAAGQVRVNDIPGGDVIVEVNLSGPLAADMAIRLAGTTLASMNTGDFVL